jgi:glycogen operon protein
VRWAEWNGKYRDCLRHYWKGDHGHVPELASRLAGSADIYSWSDRGAYASINFVTAHDGYTLHDLVSYEQKHNEANGENNQDGHNDNISRNWGVEGPTDDPGILDLRYRSIKNFLASLAFSQGVPMLSHGDEVGRTQSGNNNAYAQDNDISWVNWELDARRQDLLNFTRRVFAVRQAYPVLRRRHFFRGEPVGESGLKDVTWLSPAGREMAEGDWSNPAHPALGMLINGDATDEMDDRGRPMKGETLLLLTNASPEPVRFTLPALEKRGLWSELVSTAHGEAWLITDESVELAPYSLMLLRHGRDRRQAIEPPSRSDNVQEAGR